MTQKQFRALVYSGLESALFEASTMLWGAILALSYYSAVSASFSANALEAKREDARG